jgi:hypothetical protein
MDSRLKIGVWILVLVSILTAGCVAPLAAGRLQTRSEQVSVGAAESVQAYVVMGAGRLQIEGGADSLLEAGVRYSHRWLAPDIRYRVKQNGQGVLDIEQADGPGIQMQDDYLNDWDLAFNNEIPLDLQVTLGAGECELDLNALHLKSFTMQVGAGQATLNLADYSGGDLEIDIQGGVGELTLFLPDETRVEVSVRGGLGEINASGLKGENGLYVNDNSDSGPLIEIRVRAGIGQLNLISR